MKFIISLSECIKVKVQYMPVKDYNKIYLACLEH